MSKLQPGVYPAIESGEQSDDAARELGAAYMLVRSGTISESSYYFNAQGEEIACNVGDLFMVLNAPQSRVWHPAIIAAYTRIDFDTVAPPAVLQGKFEHGKWHVWNGTSGVLLSNEETKELTQHDTVDACINHLWIVGEQDASRALGKHVKAQA